MTKEHINNDKNTDLLNRKKKFKSIKFGPLIAILVTVFAYISSQIIGYILVAFGYTLAGKDSEVILTQPNIVTQFFLFFTIESLVVLIVFFYLKSKNISLAEIGISKKFKLNDLGRAILVFISYFIILIFVTSVVGGLTSINTEQEQQIGFEGAKTGLELILVFVSLAILPPIAEEILMRGFLYSGLRKKLNYPISAVIVSVVFALLHLQLGSGAPPLWTAAIDTFILSLFLVYLREKTGAIWAGMVVHFIKNSLAFLFLFVIHTGGM